MTITRNYGPISRRNANIYYVCDTSTSQVKSSRENSDYGDQYIQYDNINGCPVSGYLYINNIPAEMAIWSLVYTSSDVTGLVISELATSSNGNYRILTNFNDNGVPVHRINYEKSAAGEWVVVSEEDLAEGDEVPLAALISPPPIRDSEDTQIWRLEN